MTSAPQRPYQLAGFLPVATTGVEFTQVSGDAWKQMRFNTRMAILHLGLMAAPRGSSEWGNGLAYTKERFLELQPDSAGKRLAARWNKENGSRFAMGIGIYAADWQWYPDIYQDEQGTPNQLVITGDGFAMARIRLGTDGVWRWDWMRNPEMSAKLCGGFEKLSARERQYEAFDSRYAVGLRSAMGLPPDADLTSLIGQPVSEDEFLRVTKREPAATFFNSFGKKISCSDTRCSDSTGI